MAARANSGHSPDTRGRAPGSSHAGTVIDIAAIVALSPELLNESYSGTPRTFTSVCWQIRAELVLLQPSSSS
jgi:hypothetical protein